MNPASTAAALSPRRVKLILAAITLCMFTMGFSMYKLLPMQNAIQSFFGINVAAYGYLNTAQNWFVIIFTIPFGFVIRKMSTRWCMFWCFVLLLGGSLVQVFTTNYIVFIIGRMLEGGGYGFLSLLAHSLTANLVPSRRLGFWSSLLIAVAMFAQVILTNGATLLMTNLHQSFQTVFFVVVLIQAAVLVFWMIVVPSSLQVTGTASNVKPTREQTMRVYKSVDNWLVSIAVAFFNIAFVAFSAFVIGYLQIRGMEANAAATTYSFTSLLAIPSMLVFGWLSNRLSTVRKLCTLSSFACIVALLLLAHIPISMIWIYVLFFGTLPRSIAGLSQAASPYLAEVPMDIPLVNSLRNTITQVGNVVGGIILGYLIQFCGYEFTIYVLCALMAIAGVCWILAKKIP